MTIPHTQVLKHCIYCNYKGMACRESDTGGYIADMLVGPGLGRFRIWMKYLKKHEPIKPCGYCWFPLGTPDGFASFIECRIV